MVRRLPACAARDDRGRRGDELSQSKINQARDSDAEQPAQIGAAEQIGGDRSLERADQAVFHRPSGGETRQEGNHSGPVYVALDAGLR